MTLQFDDVTVKAIYCPFLLSRHQQETTRSKPFNNIGMKRRFLIRKQSRQGETGDVHKNVLPKFAGISKNYKLIYNVDSSLMEHFDWL